MDTPFPFGFPLPTAFYLSLYVATLAIHVVFMNYVLAGAGYVAFAALTQGDRLFAGPEGGRTVADVLIDWLPFMLSGAITAAIAPLLFVQILYQRAFYTANLLLFHRWMSILPVLIAGFYALYLLKTAWIRRQPSWRVAVIGLVPFACFAFTGYSWTENHLLSVRTLSEWSEFFRANRAFHYETQLVPRLSVWACGALPTMALIVAWQLRYLHGQGQPPAANAFRGLGMLATTGIGAALVGVGYMLTQVDVWHRACLGPIGLPYFLIACLGLALQSLPWLTMSRQDAVPSRRQLLAATAGVTLTILGMTVCREAIRLTTLGEEAVTALFPRHAKASGMGGLVVFLLFLTLNAGLVALCIVLVRRGKAPEGKVQEGKGSEN